MKRVWRWLTRSPEHPITPWRVVVWWELRRIPFNIIIGGYGVFCLVVFFWAIVTSGRLQHGEDAVEPIAVTFAPVGINLLYTLGWLVEIPTRLLKRGTSDRFGPVLLIVGLASGIFLCTLPMAVWVGLRMLQLAGLAH